MAAYSCIARRSGVPAVSATYRNLLKRGVPFIGHKEGKTKRSCRRGQNNTRRHHCARSLSPPAHGPLALELGTSHAIALFAALPATEARIDMHSPSRAATASVAPLQLWYVSLDPRELQHVLFDANRFLLPMDSEPPCTRYEVSQMPLKRLHTCPNFPKPASLMAELYMIHDHIGRQALLHHGVALLHSVTTLQQDSRKARLF